MQSNDLKSFEKTPWLFVFTSQGTDHFRVIVPDDDLAVNDELAGLYWDVVERYPDYEFRIEPVPAGCFDESSVPVSAVEYDVGKEGKGRLDIREVAGAWKGHEKLLEELRHLREDWD